MKNWPRYARVIKLFMNFNLEPCQSGLSYLFAKEAGASKPLGGSNPPGSANFKNCYTIINMKETITTSEAKNGIDLSQIQEGSIIHYNGQDYTVTKLPTPEDDRYSIKNNKTKLFINPQRKN